MDSNAAVVPLGQVVELKRGYDLPRSARTEGAVPVVSSSGISGHHDEAKAEPPGVVTGRYGTIGEVFYLREPFWPLNTTLYVRDFKGNDPRFVSYLLRTIDYQSCVDKAAVPGVNRNHLHMLPVWRPSVPQQRAIAHILGTLDDKIELNRRMNETLEAIARAIFKSWFVDFDPVRAKADGRKPIGMDAEIADLFPDSFEDSALGKVPRGWHVEPIGDVVRCVGGATPSTKEPLYWVGGSFPFATPKDMSRMASPALLDTERHLTEEGVAKISSGRLPRGTVLLSSRAPIGYLAVAEVEVSVNQGIIAMICDGTLPNHYVLHWVKANMDAILANAGGTTFAEISKRNFRPIPALLPSPGVLEVFAQRVEPLHRRIVANLKGSVTVAAIRDSMLPKLLSGDLRFSEGSWIVGDTSDG